MGKQVLVNKIVKNLALTMNMMAFIEKRDQDFFHIDVTKELMESLGVTSDLVTNKTLTQIHQESIAKTRYTLYEKAWNGEEVFYEVNFSLNSKCGYYGVLSPVYLNQKINRIIAFILPKEIFPTQLLQIIA